MGKLHFALVSMISFPLRNGSNDFDACNSLRHFAALSLGRVKMWHLFLMVFAGHDFFVLSLDTFGGDGLLFWSNRVPRVKGHIIKFNIHHRCVRNEMIFHIGIGAMWEMVCEVDGQRPFFLYSSARFIVRQQHILGHNSVSVVLSVSCKMKMKIYP